jgi:predicted small lipoprotein YifL
MKKNLVTAVVVLALLTALEGCGHKGPPRPPSDKPAKSDKSAKPDKSESSGKSESLDKSEPKK